MTYLNVKLRQPGDASFLQREGVLQVTQSFPNEEDEVLLSFYLLLVLPEAKERLVRELAALPEVAFVKPSAARVLIRPRKG